jgi:hypothetical protein
VREDNLASIAKTASKRFYPLIEDTLVNGLSFCVSAILLREDGIVVISHTSGQTQTAHCFPEAKQRSVQAVCQIY